MLSIKYNVLPQTYIFNNTCIIKPLRFPKNNPHNHIFPFRHSTHFYQTHNIIKKLKYLISSLFVKTLFVETLFTQTQSKIMSGTFDTTMGLGLGKKMYSCITQSFCSNNKTQLHRPHYTNTYSHEKTIYSKKLYKENESIIGPNITHIILNSCCDFSVDLTMDIVHLSTISSFNQPLIFTPNIQTIHFGTLYNLPIELPKYVHSLIVGCNYNQNVILTKHIERLYFSMSYNIPLTLSKNLINITFGLKFNQPLILTKHISTLSLSYYYNNPIILSKNLLDLSGGNFSKIILNKKLKRLDTYLLPTHHVILPSHIKYLRIHSMDKYIIEHSDMYLNIICDNHTIIDNIPNGMKNIVIEFKKGGMPMDNLPSKHNTNKTHGTINTSQSKCTII